MKHHTRVGMVALAMMASTAVSAQIVDWHFEGVVSSMTADLAAFQHLTSTPVDQLWKLSAGQVFAGDFVVDLAADKVLDARLSSKDGLLTYVDAREGPYVATVSSFRTNSGSPGMPIYGDFVLEDYWPRRIIGDINTVAEPFWMRSFALKTVGANLPSSMTLRDVSDALASGAYSSVSATATLGPSSWAPGYSNVGNVTFNFTSVSVSAVPELSTLSGFGFGLVGLIGVASRRRLRGNS